MNTNADWSPWIFDASVLDASECKSAARYLMSLIILWNLLLCIELYKQSFRWKWQRFQKAHP